MSDKSNWSIEEDVALLQAWVLVIYDPITGNEMKVQHIWHKIHAQFVKMIQCTFWSEQSMSSRYRHLHKDLKAWQETLAKVEGIYQSGINLADMFNLDNKKSFTWHECWNIVKQTQKYKAPLHESTTEESPLKTPLETPWQPLLNQ
ncbi:unnamed protein product [Malus baccata var. baccata]